MLKNTFRHVPGIGAKTEKNLWAAGIYSWEDAINATSLPLSPKAESLLKTFAEQSLCTLEQKKDPVFFYNLLPSKIHWRLFSEFIDSAAYLDIETTGLDSSNGRITTIALYDRKKILYYINGINLDDFVKDIEKYNLIITYNGKTFDIPWIESYFGIRLPHAQIDLRYVLGGLGFKGGLKGCEKSFGIDRKELDGVDGFFAVLLWNEYVRNSSRAALETLLAYNIEDVINLDFLMVSARNIMTEASGLSIPSLEIYKAPARPFSPDPATVERLKRKLMHY